MRGRPGRIYAIRTRRWTTWSGEGRPQLGYVGKTRQAVGRRLEQHLQCQPWADLYYDHTTVWESRRVTSFGLWWREIYYILTMFPRYNYQWNRWNPRRVPIYTAKAERLYRDRQARTGKRVGWRQ